MATRIEDNDKLIVIVLKTKFKEAILRYTETIKLCYDTLSRNASNRTEAMERLLLLMALHNRFLIQSFRTYPAWYRTPNNIFLENMIFNDAEDSINTGVFKFDNFREVRVNESVEAMSDDLTLNCIYDKSMTSTEDVNPLSVIQSGAGNILDIIRGTVDTSLATGGTRIESFRDAYINLPIEMGDIIQVYYIRKNPTTITGIGGVNDILRTSRNTETFNNFTDFRFTFSLFRGVVTRVNSAENSSGYDYTVSARSICGELNEVSYIHSLSDLFFTPQGVSPTYEGRADTLSKYIKKRIISYFGKNIALGGQLLNNILKNCASSVYFPIKRGAGFGFYPIIQKPLYVGFTGGAIPYFNAIFRKLDGEAKTFNIRQGDMVINVLTRFAKSHKFLVFSNRIGELVIGKFGGTRVSRDITFSGAFGFRHDRIAESNLKNEPEGRFKDFFLFRYKNR